MTTFEYQRGTVAIDSQEVKIEGSALDALKIWFRDRKFTALFLTLAMIFVVVMGILDVEPSRLLLVAFAAGVSVQIGEFVLKYVGVIRHESVIPRESIEEVSYTRMGRLRPSKLAIHYSGDGNETHTRKLQLANPLMSPDDRVEHAVEACREHDMSIAERSG
ncbi:hypothetical protein [Halococcus hamelinensis]|uniref:Uncharacterized protein n=1 Tax=Halococcus hamelinensis 100A6 TaxID=1132509 RepID=M0LZG4_9EURY|nr:hypothetical protein [Halococcus hamelinensis]EMA38841.1 hypothetical protein C447_08463 [Halococcus hamelinensis 100A6]